MQLSYCCGSAAKRYIFLAANEKKQHFFPIFHSDLALGKKKLLFFHVARSGVVSYQYIEHPAATYRPLFYMKEYDDLSYILLQVTYLYSRMNRNTYEVVFYIIKNWTCFAFVKFYKRPISICLLVYISDIFSYYVWFNLCCWLYLSYQCEVHPLISVTEFQLWVLGFHILFWSKMETQPPMLLNLKKN